MRILKVTQSYHPFLEKGGQAVKVHVIARELARRGHQVTVLTADLGLERAHVKQCFAVPVRWGWRAEESGTEAIYLRTRARYRGLTWNPSVLDFCRQRSADFDLAHIYGLYDLLGPTVAFFCRRRALPYVVEPIGMYRPIVRNLRLKRLYHSLLGNQMLRGARQLIATSEQERQELIEGGVPEKEIVVRRNGIELPNPLPQRGTFRHRWKIPAEAKVILFLGRLVSKKSPELMLEAFALWRKCSGQLQASVLVLAGPDERDGYRQQLETLASQLGINEHVLFTGALYDDAKWAAYRDADVFVLPSQNENFGNTVAEAVACGTPVIVTERCGIAPLVDQKAGLVVRHDREALQASLSRLLEDKTLLEHLRAGCTDVTGALSWDEPLCRMEQLYAELLADGREK